MITEQLKRAIQLIQEGNLGPARDLLLEELKSHPENIDAWDWALRAAQTEKEKRSISHKLLSLDPTHSAALDTLQSLDQARVDPDSPDQIITEAEAAPTPGRVRSSLSGLLKLGLDWVSSLPSGCSFLTIFAGIVLGVFIYTRVNTSIFGLTGRDLDKLDISNSYEEIRSEDFYWEVQFELSGKSRYQGTVRHAAPIRIREFAILTHDILITTGDFADPDVVNTNVIDHKFFWKAPNSRSPEGTINLIHAIPATKEIYQQMLDIRKWDTVQISGREILNVKAYQSDSNYLGAWQDTGCNTLLVESVTILTDDQ